MTKKLCSACLLGVKCRYDEKNNANEKILSLAKKEVLIPICPEQLGGQAMPRPNAEIVGGDGHDVLDKKAKVVESNGTDVTQNFIDGAEEVLKLAKLFDVKEAILKQKSPSCGCGKTYNGAFSKTLIKGDGVTAALLKKNGLKVIAEEDL
ncbi:DUF523 domain-containing protein [Patescibacteria group bacterium]|nr:DUF523 domain-containing protein [Patescibacteria group bacterium]